MNSKNFEIVYVAIRKITLKLILKRVFNLLKKYSNNISEF